MAAIKISFSSVNYTAFEVQEGLVLFSKLLNKQLPVVIRRTYEI